MTDPNRLLNDIRIATPCTASWNQMTGTDTVRFGGECKLKGCVISDSPSDLDLIATGYDSDESDAAQKALSAGLDMSLQSGIYAGHVATL